MYTFRGKTILPVRPSRCREFESLREEWTSQNAQLDSRCSDLEEKLKSREEELGRGKFDSNRVAKELEETKLRLDQGEKDLEDR